jgi:hypothetical protein
VRLTETGIPDLSAAFAVTTQSRHNVSGMAAFLQQADVSTSSLVRLPKPGARPHYLCPDGWVDGMTGNKSPLRTKTNAFEPMRLPSGVLYSGGFQTINAGIVAIYAGSPCPARPTLSSSEQLVVDGPRAQLVSWSGDAGTVVAGLRSGSVLTMSAIDDHYEVLVQESRRPLERYEVRDGVASLQATYTASPFTRACQLGADKLLWCANGPLAPDGQQTPDAGVLNGCEPIVEACPDLGRVQKRPTSSCASVAAGPLSFLVFLFWRRRADSRRS